MDRFLTWGYVGLAFCAFLAGTPLPMNSEAALSLALVYDWPAVWCITACVIGNWLGASVNYLLGRLCSYEQLLRWTKANPERLEKVRRFLCGRGAWLALCSSLPIVGNLVIISYGIMRTPFWRVGSIMLLGQVVRYCIWAAFTLGIASYLE